MRLFQHSAVTLAVLAISSLALVGCGDDKKPDAGSAPAAGSSSPAAAAPKPAADGEAQAKARNAYSKAYNGMIDDNRAVAAYYRSYKGLGISSKKHSPNGFYGGPDDIQRMIKPIKEVRGAGGKEFWPLNLQTMEHEAPKKPRFDLVGKARKIDDLRERRRFLLDNAESERAVQAALEETGQGRTVITIAHRLSTVRAADVIYVMDKGRVVGHGDHAGLMKSSPLYRALASLQMA